MEHYRQSQIKEVPCLQALVDELLKDKPDTSIVKARMKELGLAYSEDPIECMNRVLKIMHPDQKVETEGREARL
ncbi:MAG: hypothetical protein K2X47_18440 [Bdellovibrionales bacterium]|nr:hypothetical protein [Bdellovibrionales bacterium]